MAPATVVEDLLVSAVDMLVADFEKVFVDGFEKMFVVDEEVIDGWKRFDAARKLAGVGGEFASDVLDIVEKSSGSRGLWLPAGDKSARQ